jgi:hypothetical protein
VASSGIIHFCAKETPGYRLMRFITDRGTVFVKADLLGQGQACLSVYERAVAETWHGEGEAAWATNRFGTGLMLRIMRWVKAVNPDINTWVYERLTGAKARL